ncbi:MAG: MFS transporter [Pseudomonadota bacterium]
MSRPAYVLPTIVLAQFAGTSLWFAGNAVLPMLPGEWRLGDEDIGYLTSSVQFGFITGTLVFAFLSLADRFRAQRVFMWSALAGAASNAALIGITPDLYTALVLRFATGFFLAGIYPVGMKIAATWYAEGLGRALGYLVGALVLGTAFPHALVAAGATLPWQTVMVTVSVLAALGGLAIGLGLPDGPHLPGSSPFNPRVLIEIFRSRQFRASAFGYFGHMWELYAFWAFVPLWLAASATASDATFNVSAFSFTVIAVGALGCAVGGQLVARWGSARVAALQLAASGICCVLSPLLFGAALVPLALFMLIWGITVVGDSPQFSTLNAQTAPPQYVGSALTLANCLGFAVSIVSIQLLAGLIPATGAQYLFWLLLPGPILGLLALRPALARSAGR